MRPLRNPLGSTPLVFFTFPKWLLPWQRAQDTLYQGAGEAAAPPANPTPPYLG